MAFLRALTVVLYLISALIIPLSLFSPDNKAVPGISSGPVEEEKQALASSGPSSPTSPVSRKKPADRHSRNQSGVTPPDKEPQKNKGSISPDSVEVVDRSIYKMEKNKSEVKLPSPIYHGQGGNKVAITFDDGPYPGMTEQYLNVLQQQGVRATFFMVGSRINRYPDQARKVVEQGSEIGSHSWRHAELDKLDPATLNTDLQNVAQEVYAATGQEIKLLRPPYGRYSTTVLTAAAGLDQRLVFWNTDPRDWQDPPPEEIVKKALQQVKPGSIIVLHEGHKNTLEALPEIIRQLRARGLEPVTVSELLGQASPQEDK